jgi:hypothetical protein
MEADTSKMLYKTLKEDFRDDYLKYALFFMNFTPIYSSVTTQLTNEHINLGVL